LKPEKSFLVAGENFGVGSSREHAPLVIKFAKINAVLAKSFARIFYRNAFNIGLPLIECDTDTIDEGDEIELDLENNLLKNVTKNEEIEFIPIPDVMKRFLRNDGVINCFKKQGSFDFNL